jgi:outer membrane protein assembly factor BamE (lipoprotein component of BamABCDE complex)
MNKKQFITPVIIIFLISGCSAATAINSNRESLIKNDWHKDTLQDFHEGNIKIGMAKEQVFYLLGSPTYWTRYELSEGIFESWFYAAPEQTKLMWVLSCDFKDNLLLGYSGGTMTNKFSTKGCYYTEDKVYDIREYRKTLQGQ